MVLDKTEIDKLVSGIKYEGELVVTLYDKQDQITTSESDMQIKIVS